MLPLLMDFHILGFWCSLAFDYQKRATAVLQSGGWGYFLSLLNWFLDFVEYIQRTPCMYGRVLVRSSAIITKGI